jgi:hypothetical protein
MHCSKKVAGKKISQQYLFMLNFYSVQALEKALLKQKSRTIIEMSQIFGYESAPSKQH